MDGKGSKNTHKKQEERSAVKKPFKTMYLPQVLYTADCLQQWISVVSIYEYG